MSEEVSWFRYEDSWTEGEAPFLWRPLVLRRTRRGVWVQGYTGGEKFVLEGEGKRYAHSTQEAALRSYLARKTRQASIYAARHDRAAGYRDAAAAMLQRLRAEGAL